MNLSRLSLAVVGVCSGLLLVACGGSSSSGSVATVTSSAGKAVDGYLNGSTVVCTATGAKVTTNATGDFTFTPACASTVSVTGGTNADTGLAFTGTLQAPAGSAMVTPLTSLMVGSNLTAAQIATAFGLAAGTDVTKVDPIQNLDLQKKTLAAQQIIQQVADVLGALSKDTSAASVQALYAEVAKAVASTLASGTTPLISATGEVSGSLVASIVKASVANVAASTNSALANVAKTVAGLSGNSVSELIAPAITAQASALTAAGVTSATITALTRTQQTNSALAQFAVQINSTGLLSTANDAKVDLTSAGTAFIAVSNAFSAGGSALTSAASSLNSIVATIATGAGVTPPTVTDATVTTTTAAGTTTTTAAGATTTTVAATTTTTAASAGSGTSSNTNTTTVPLCQMVSGATGGTGAAGSYTGTGCINPVTAQLQ